MKATVASGRVAWWRLGRGPARRDESGQILVLLAVFMLVLIVLLAVAVNLGEVRKAQLGITVGAQNAAADGARLDLGVATLLGTDPGGAARRIAIPATAATQKRVRRSLALNLEGVAYLMDGITPEEAAEKAEIAIVNPQSGRCERNPLAPPSTSREDCYYDAFVAMRVSIPMRALWGSISYTYETVVVASVTDNEVEQHPATAMPTSTRPPIATWQIVATPGGRATATPAPRP
jgi:hypothetical protein